jgi:hypothetical protein
MARIEYEIIVFERDNVSFDRRNISKCRVACGIR